MAAISEPESLASDEQLTAHLARHAFDRLIMLSDGIFAIATTLAALEIRLPPGITDPLSALAAMWRPLLAYAISFGVIGVLWASSRDLFARLARVTRPITVLTLTFLCLVALIPVGVGGIAQSSATAGFRIYAATMTIAGALNAALWAYAGWAPGVMRAEVPAEYRWNRALGAIAMPILFVPMTFLPLDRFYVVMFPSVLVIVVIRRRLLPRLLHKIFAEDSPVETLEAEASATP
ncbi:MAG: DUF1211 domain-containing protein [Porphyrobacter sp.]|nr:DUF1211 domain-containing protein [Porphyrobacter sp.]